MTDEGTHRGPMHMPPMFVLSQPEALCEHVSLQTTDYSQRSRLLGEMKR